MRIESRRYHRFVWTVLGVLLPIIVLYALFIKQTPPRDIPAVQLEAPEAD